MTPALSLLQARLRERTRSSSLDPGFQQRAPTRSTLASVGPAPCVLRYRGRRLVHQTSLAEHNRCLRSPPLVCRRLRLSRELSILPFCRMRTTCGSAMVLLRCLASTCPQRKAQISAPTSTSIFADSDLVKRKRCSMAIPLDHLALVLPRLGQADTTIKTRPCSRYRVRRSLTARGARSTGSTRSAARS